MGLLGRFADGAAFRRSATALTGNPAIVTISVRGLFSRHARDARMRRVQAFMEALGYRCVSTAMRVSKTAMTFQKVDPHAGS